MLLCADDSDSAPFSVGDLAFNAGYTAPFVNFRHVKTTRPSLKMRSSKVNSNVDNFGALPNNQHRC